MAKVTAAALVIAVGLAALVFLVVQLAVVFLAVLAAVILTALLMPLVRRLRAWRVPGTLASGMGVLVAVAVIAGVLSWVIPKAVQQVSTNKDQLKRNVEELAERVGGSLPAGASLSGIAERAPGFLQEHSTKIVSGVVTVTEIVTGLLLALVLGVFFLRDGEKIVQGGLSHLSEEKRRVFGPALERAWSTLGRWIRGAAVIALVDAIGIGVGLAILGVPLALPLAVLTFFAAFIPVAGATLAGALCVVVAWATGGTTDALITLGIVIGVQQFEGNVLEPMIMGRAVPLHPAVVLIVVAAGALLAGIPGAFVAVPLTAMAASFMKEVYARSEPPGAERRALEELPPSDEDGEEAAAPH